MSRTAAMPNADTPNETSRDRLLAAGKKLVAQAGYERTSTSTIVREADTSESQLVRHFGSKAGLLKAIFENDWRGLNAGLERVVESAASTRQALQAVLKHFITALDRDEDMARLMLFEGRRPRGYRREVTLSEGFAQFFGLMCGLIKRGQQNGEIDAKLSPTAMSAAVIGLVEGMLRDRLIYAELSGRSPYSESDIHTVFAVLMRGLVHEPSPP